MTTPAPRDERSTGLAYALAAYLSWGLLPVYFKALKHVPAREILAHRVVWSLALLAALLALRGARGAFTAPFRDGRWTILALTTTLIASNWLIYIWAVNSGRVVEASLGYFINPLVNVLLGVAFLGETLSGRQRAVPQLFRGRAHERSQEIRGAIAAERPPVLGDVHQVFVRTNRLEVDHGDRPDLPTE